MAFKSEAQVWAEERERVAQRKSARATAMIRWFVRLPAEPDPNMFAWRSVAELIPVTGEEP
jgi:hypothetical protein